MDEHHASEEEEFGGYGTPTPEQEMPRREGQQADQPRDEDTSTPEQDDSAAVPSADAELDDSNSEGTKPGKPLSSEPKGDATGLPGDKSPKDDDGETFDAG